ncbi:MAG: SMC family ATPase [Candidatus Micrarchaeota archaeon]
MITSLKLTNWRSHESSLFEFSKGTNILVGIMGSGKSSVMDGLCFALFGNFPALQHRKVKISEVIRSRPSQERSAKVELKFMLNGSEHTILRTINIDGKTEAELRIDGRLLEGPQPKRVNEIVGQLLSMDYDLFTRAVYSEQNNIDYFLELPRGDRKKQIDQLLGIDRFEKARSGIVKTINRLKDIRSDKAALIKEGDMKKAKEELTKSKSDKERIEMEFKRAGQSLTELTARKTPVE